MKSEMIDKKKIVTEAGEQITLQYHLITIQIYDENEKPQDIFGVEIQKRKDDTILERDFVYAISEDRRKVLDMIGQMSKNTVTPVSLISILGDFEGTAAAV